MEGPLHVGLVGCGRWGSHILRDLIHLGCQVTVADCSLVARQRALDSGAARVVSSPDQLIGAWGIVVATPTDCHADTIDQVLGFGVPVFVEKPLTADPRSAQALAERAPERLFVMDKWRYHPGIEVLAKVARSGELGPVLGLRTTRLQWGNPHSDVDPVWILAPHDLSLGLEILGCLPSPRFATAEVVNGTATGLLGVLGESPWFVFEVSARSPTTRREVRLHCRDGVATLDDAYADHVTITRSADAAEPSVARIERVPISDELPLLRELAAFLDHLRRGPPPRSSAAEGSAIVSCLSNLRELAGVDVPRSA